MVVQPWLRKLLQSCSSEMFKHFKTRVLKIPWKSPVLRKSSQSCPRRYMVAQRSEENDQVDQVGKVRTRKSACKLGSWST